MATAPDDLDDVLEHLDRGLRILKERQPFYADGKSYYDGDRAEVFANVAIAAALNAEAKAHPVNLAHIPVDAVIDKVNLTAITAKETAANTALAAALEANDVEDEADDWQRKAGYFGDYYVIIDPLDEDDAGRATKVDIVGASPLSTVMVYKGKDGRTPLFAVRRWLEGKTPHASVHYDDIDVLLVGVDGSDGFESKGYTPDLDDDDDPDSYRIPHAGGRILVVHYAVDGKPYGTPLHRKAWGPQDAITKISATNLATVDAQGFPTRYALLDPKAELDDDIDDDFGDDGLPTTPASSDGLTKPTNGSKLKTGPGLIHLLRGVSSVGQWDAAEASGFLLNLDWYTRAMAVATGTPLFEFDLTGEQPSGESRRRASARLNKHARKVMRALGKAHETLGDTVLGVLGIDNAEVTASFQPVETETDTEGLELVGAKVKQGVPLRVALLEAGYSTEQVDEWWPKDAPNISPSMWGVLGELLVKLGTAETLGAITAAEVVAILPTILTNARNEGPVDEAEPIVESESPEVVKAKADALGALVRAGADQEGAARKVGLEGVEFPNVPTTVRIPEADAAGLEVTGAAVPA
jgi:hypothetical protein